MLDMLRRWFVGDPPPPPDPSPALRQEILRKLAESPPGLGVPYRRLAALTPRLDVLRSTLADMHSHGEIEDPGPTPSDDQPIYLDGDSAPPAEDAPGLDEADRLTAHAAALGRQVTRFAGVAANTFGTRPALLQLLAAYQDTDDRAAAARRLRDARRASEASPPPAPTPIPIPTIPPAPRRRRIVE